MGRGLKRVALAASTALTLATALLVGTASAAAADTPDLSSRAAIEQYLVSIGVDPATAVWQTGLKNYAGPSCPGKGWNCVRANAPIVQIAAPLGTNLFSCTGLDCVAVQVAPQGGNNGAQCDRDDRHDPDALQVCDVTQVNSEGNPNSSNAARITQNIQQSTSSSEAEAFIQEARQVARITQVNGEGKNIAGINQVIGQVQNDRGGAAITQSQEAHQAATVNQTTVTGTNSSDINERQNQSQRASGTTGLVTQKQNTIVEADTTTNADNDCDQPEDAPDSYDPTSTLGQRKNQCADVLQNSSLTAGGRGTSNLFQAIAESQVISRAGTINQDQGEVTGSTGQWGDVDQHSFAPVTHESLHETNQDQTATNISGGIVFGDQFKNTGDPRCCANQTLNLGSSADIVMRTVQTASSDNAIQLAAFDIHCLSTGTCHTFRSATIDGGDPATRECESPPEATCDEKVICTETTGEGEEPETNCAPPPPPPPPDID
jgi:hypothetical protein